MDEDGTAEPHSFEELRQAWERKRNGNGQDRPPPLKLYWGRDALVLQPSNAVAAGICHRGALTMWYGPPKSGKSFLLTDLSHAIAAGKPSWFGHRIVQPGPVLHIALEGGNGVPRRLTAIQQREGMLEPWPHRFVLATGRMHIIELRERGYVVLPHTDDIQRAIDDMTDAGHSPVMVNIDTVFRAMGGGNVNDSTHANAFLAAAARLMEQSLAVCAVHHAGKSNGSPVGSVSFMGGADTLIRTENLADGTHTWEVEFAKDDAATDARRFKLEVVDVGLDPDGLPASSCIVVPLFGKTPDKKIRDLSPRQAEFRDILMDAFAEEGKFLCPLPDMPVVKTLSRDAVRAALIRKGWFHTETEGVIKLKRADHSEVWNALRALKIRGNIGFDNANVWLTP